MSERKITRAGALKRLGILVGGAGVGAAGGFAARGDGKSGGGASRVWLRAPQLAFGDPDATSTSVIRAPSRLIGDAALVDKTGRNRGSFTGILMPAGQSGLELHTFVLDDGTLMGMGSASGSTYSIVGGTGAYAGAAGGYTMEHRAASAGGDGSAEFVIDIARREQPWH
jgi:hypothetical protein